MRIGVYPGSFDPPTLGHLNIIERASTLFDKVIVATMVNGSKKSAFTMEEKADFLRRMTQHLPNVEIDTFGGLLADYGLPARYAQRKNAYVAYLKEGEMVAGFLTLTGAMNSTLAFEEARVMRQVAGSVNRIHNFEDANMNKAATTAAAQLVDIECIQRAKGLQSLPPRLREAAELRLNNPESTLSELAQMAEVSKSGLNHRFAKLAALAEEYRGSGLGYTQEEE